MFHMSDEELGVGTPDGRPEHVVKQDLELLADFRNLFENELEPMLLKILEDGKKESAEIARSLKKNNRKTLARD